MTAEPSTPMKSAAAEGLDDAGLDVLAAQRQLALNKGQVQTVSLPEALQAAGLTAALSDE